MKHRLYTYDLWGNAMDGWDVNDVRSSAITVDVDENTTDRAINRRLRSAGAHIIEDVVVHWEGEHGYARYGETKSGKPICELRVED
jgi:hypothetical protein